MDEKLKQMNEAKKVLNDNAISCPHCGVLLDKSVIFNKKEKLAENTYRKYGRCPNCFLIVKDSM